MCPCYPTGRQLVDGGAGFYGYNSTYNLGIMTSVFFTELSLIGARTQRP